MRPTQFQGDGDDGYAVERDDMWTGHLAAGVVHFGYDGSETAIATYQLVRYT